MTETLWAAVIGVLGALAGTALSQLFTLLNKREESASLRDQRLIDIEISTLRDLQLVIRDASLPIPHSNISSPESVQDFVDAVSTRLPTIKQMGPLLLLSSTYFTKDEFNTLLSNYSLINEEQELYNQVLQAIMDEDTQKLEELTAQLNDIKSKLSESQTQCLALINKLLLPRFSRKELAKDLKAYS
ncbi:MAG TPA: hypothetical protein VJ183_13520 [Chloroflexia bacterium]|nr:hypothetical protein [Chloroflexia bacterium]